VYIPAVISTTGNVFSSLHSNLAATDRRDIITCIDLAYVYDRTVDALLKKFPTFRGKVLTG